MRLLISQTTDHRASDGQKDPSPHFFPSPDFLSIRYTMIRRLRGQQSHLYTYN